MSNPLPKILKFFTGKNRYQVKAGVNFRWSDKSWTHNIFRAYELLFWRKYGIRPEMSFHSDGKKTVYYIHTLEAGCALFEQKVRELFAWKFVKVRVYVPQMALVGGLGRVPSSPFLFAIAFDNGDGKVQEGTNISTTTLSYTCTGSDLTLASGAFQIGAASATLSCTYSAVSMNAAVNQRLAGVSVEMKMFYLANPATGANNLVMSSNVSTSAATVGVSGISLTGTDTASPLGNTSSSGQNISTTPNLDLTTANANSEIIDFVVVLASGGSGMNGPNATGANQTRRYLKVPPNNTGTMAGSTTDTTTAGLYSVSYSQDQSRFWGMLDIEIKAPAAAGPANVKTWDSVVQATGIKTYFGNALANTKSVDGII